ncbi:MAG: radical SAM protein [Clostridia bacterium]|jgi:putative pyruvate formate lyase activating enzyme
MKAIKPILCNICPRNCLIDRSNSSDFCGAKSLKIALVMKHFWEEPIISGTNGSGAIFFSHCSLKCIYCQNYKISSGGLGKETTIEKLAGLFKQLEQSGVHNINLVSPTHYTTEIIAALNIYKPKIPIVWNTSGYETSDTIKKLKEYVDIYLCDFKYFDNKLSNEYSSAPDYMDKCTSALLQMRKNQPIDIIKNGIMQKGIIVRHLVLPTHFSDSIKILEWVKQNMGTDTIISLMNQYTPCYKALSHPILKNKLKPIEYKIVLNKFLKLGFTSGFSQEKSSATCDFIPDFEKNDDSFIY